MLTSIEWLNKYLNPGNATADEVDDALTGAGFPIESRDDRADDVVLDVELTSNRGDCLCHVGLAREVAAKTGRALIAPSPGVAATGPDVRTVTSVENSVGELCPRFTARVIRDVKVRPSPAWLVSALERIGQRSINNVVDASNFVLHELGHPSHAFDLDALAGKRLIVRHAKKGERLVALDAKEHKLIEDDLVVADAERAVSLAGVIGGLDTGVTTKTTNILLELATWEPLAIRATARRLGISTDAGYRFERRVDARDIQWASDRLCELVLELAGGELCAGMIDAPGSRSESASPSPIELRASRCTQIIGIDIPVKRMSDLLSAVGFEVDARGDVLACVPPNHRHDVMREIDLIEEVARLHGYENIRVADTVETHLDLKHPPEWARREQATARIGQVLTGQGFYETVTFSFLEKSHADLFAPRGVRLLKVDEERRKATPYLRPSAIPSLLSCRRANQDARLERAEGVRLFEIASAFGEADDGDAHRRQTIETRNLDLYADAPAEGKLHERLQEAVRRVRGAIEEVAGALGGQGVRVEIEPSDEAFMDALEGETFGCVRINGVAVGFITTLSKKSISAWGLDQPGAAATVNLRALIDLYPPKVTVRELPRFPAIERDLSLVVDERIAWQRIEREIEGLSLEHFDGLRFIGVYRGKQAGAGKKSVTLRARFRDEQRTLRNEEVDPAIDRAVKHLGRVLGAELRA